MIYRNIEFEASPFKYHLEFTGRITLVRGDSATGKTYLYQMLEDLKQLEQYQAVKLFNYKSDDFHERLKICQNKFIVIDNADTILDDEDKRFINFEISNQYLLFLRNCDGLNVSADSFTILQEEDHYISLRKELVLSDHEFRKVSDVICETLDLEIIPAYGFPQEIGALFSEYTDMLIEGDSSFQNYLDVQCYDEELKHLEAKYGLPYGRLYLACYNGETAGCIALRRIDDHNCEMKRLYVRQQFRGKHIGDRLVQKIITEAKQAGYSYMLLDTLPFLKGALHLYKKYGFCEAGRYNDSPMDSSIYMKLDLAGEE